MKKYPMVAIYSSDVVESEELLIYYFVLYVMDGSSAEASVSLIALYLFQ